MMELVTSGPVAGTLFGVQISIWEAVGVFVVIGVIFLATHGAGRRSGRNDK